MTLNVNVKNRVANYQQNGSDLPVCGNSGYKVNFTFDDEWNNYERKTARFIWGGKYHDVEFTGDTCDVPVVSNTQNVMVGVYAGEMKEDGYMFSTTLTAIPFLISARCGNRGAQSATGANYTNEARGYAESAKESAEQAQEANANIEQYKGLELIATFENPFAYYEDEGYSEWQMNNDFEWAVRSNDVKVIFIRVTDYEKTPITWSAQDTATWEQECDLLIGCGYCTMRGWLADLLRGEFGWMCTFELYR